MSFKVVANLFLVFACVLAIYTISMAKTKPTTSTASGGFTSALSERNLAIQKANQQGRSDYSFTTNFVPGIGYPPPSSSK